MKTLLLTIILLLSSWASYAQNATLNSFFQAHRQSKETTSFAVPGWLIKLGINIASNDDQEMRAQMEPFRPLIKGLRGVRFLMVEESKNLPQGTVARFVQKLRKRDYEPLIKVKSFRRSRHCTAPSPKRHHLFGRRTARMEVSRITNPKIPPQTATCNKQPDHQT